MDSAVQGKTSAEHKINPSNGSAGWKLNLKSYTFNGKSVNNSQVTKLLLSDAPIVLLPANDYNTIYKTVENAMTSV